jgi:hypothetical protein
MKGKKSNESRRKLLKSIAAGSGAIVAGKSLPESWSKPVLDSVMLPAHAQTSNLTYSSNNVNVTTASNDRQHGEEAFFAMLANSLLPIASAGLNIGEVSGCAKVVGSMLDFEIVNISQSSFRIKAMLPLDKQLANVTYEHCMGTEQIPMAIGNINGDEVELLTEEPIFIIPAAPECVSLPNLIC